VHGEYAAYKDKKYKAFQEVRDKTEAAYMRKIEDAVARVEEASRKCYSTYPTKRSALKKIEEAQKYCDEVYSEMFDTSRRLTDEIIRNYSEIDRKHEDIYNTKCAEANKMLAEASRRCDNISKEEIGIRLKEINLRKSEAEREVIKAIEKANEYKTVISTKDYDTILEAWNYVLEKAKLLLSQLAIIDELYCRVNDTLHKLYSLNIIYHKYHRNITALSKIYEYLESGRRLHEARTEADYLSICYDIYETESRADGFIDVAKTGFENISKHLLAIQRNPYELYRITQKSNDILQRVSNELGSNLSAIHSQTHALHRTVTQPIQQPIMDNYAISQMSYFAEETARNMRTMLNIQRWGGLLHTKSPDT
jgi:hypothetical protein